VILVLFYVNSKKTKSCFSIIIVITERIPEIAELEGTV